MMRLLFVSFGLLVSAASVAQQMTAKEKTMFITPNDMGNYGFAFDNPSRNEQFAKTPFTEKSIEYDYTFKCVEGCKQSMVIQQSISIEANEKDADSTYQMEEASMKDMTGKWLKYKAFASYYPCGKRWDYKLLLSATNDAPAGFIYHYQKGNYTGTLMVIGYSFDDPQMFKDFIEPLVKRVDDVVNNL